MYTATRTIRKKRYLYTANEDLHFDGELAQVLNDLEYVTSYFYKRENIDYEIEKLSSLQYELEHDINTLTRHINNNKSLPNDEELQKTTQKAESVVSQLTHQVENINEIISQLDNSKIDCVSELSVKYNRMLHELGFIISMGRGDGYTTTETYNFYGNEQELLEKATKMLEEAKTVYEQKRETIKNYRFKNLDDNQVEESNLDNSQSDVSNNNQSEESTF